MTTAAMKKRLERLEATAPPAAAMTADEKAAAIVQVLLDDLGRARLPRPDAAEKLASKSLPPDGVDWDRWRRALEEALTAAHER